jgi:hypothetical protein
MPRKSDPDLPKKARSNKVKPNDPKKKTPVKTNRTPKLILLQGGKGTEQDDYIPDEDLSNAPIFDGDVLSRKPLGSGRIGLENELYGHHFHPLRGESDVAFRRVLANYSTQFTSPDPVTRELLYQLSVVHFDTKRAENAMHRLSTSTYEQKPEIWLKQHSGFATQRNGLQLASQRLMGILDKLEVRQQLGGGLPTHGADGRQVEEYRFWNLYKFSTDPDDKINAAIEIVCYTDGTAHSVQSVLLKDFMNGEFMKPEYGLGEQFRRLLRQYKYPLHHPFDPNRIR